MARSNNTENGSVAEGATDAEAWAVAAANRKFAIRDGRPIVSSAFDEIGYVALVSAPFGFASLSPAVHGLVAQAVLEAVQNRVGQNSKPTSAAEYQAAIDAAIAGTAETNAKDKDALRGAIETEITAKLLAVKPDATTEELKHNIGLARDAYTAKHADRIMVEGFLVPTKVSKADKPKPTRINFEA